MRLDKFISESTTLTRSQAKKIIMQGRIKSSQTVIRNSAYKVKESEIITFDDDVLNVRGERYIMLNKPEGYICSTVDEQLPSILNLISVDKKEQLFIAGRLDADTTGLTLITDQGQWSHKVTSPRKKCNKRYLVKLSEPISSDAQVQFKEGVQLKSENEPCLPATLEIIDDLNVKLTISEGKYHQVKRMFAAIGNHVISLHREQIGQIELDPKLEPGQWRYLTEQEVNFI